VEALGKIRSKLAIEPLVASLADPQSSIRNTAAGSLRQIDPQWSRSDAARQAIPVLKARLTSRDYWVRQAAADVLGRIGDIQRSEPTLNSFTDPVHYKRMAVVQSLMQMATDWDDDVRLAAVEALGRVADERAREILTESLRDCTPWVREAAEQSLGQLKAPEVGPVETGMRLGEQN
jgi:HEAT repeat protein